MFEILSLILLVAACILGLTRDGWALALLLAMFAFEQVLQASLPIFVQIPSLGNIIIGLTVAGAAYRSLRLNPEPFNGYLSPAWICCVVIYLMAVVSILWTPSFGTAWALTRWGLPYFGLFVIVGPLLISGRGSIGKFLSAFLFLGKAITLLMLFNPRFTVYTGRLGINLDALTRSNPLAMGELAGCLMIVGALWRGQRNAALFVPIRLVALVLGALLCFQSGSRGQIIFAVLISLALYPVAVRLKSVWAFLGSALALIAVALVLGWLLPGLLGFQEVRRWDAGSIEGGISVRIQNVLDVARAFAFSPAAWIVGLGFNAFAGLTTASSEPYSHVLFVDILTEQGLPAFVLLCIYFWFVVREVRWLFGAFRDSPRDRAGLACLVGLYCYELLLVNKQGYLWASVLFFLLGILIVRLRTRVAHGLDEQVEGDHFEEPEVEELAEMGRIGHARPE